jgi:hypothetical protein
MVSGQGAGGGPQNGALLKRNIYVQMNPNFRSFILDRMFKVLGKEDIDFNLYHTYGGDKGKQFLAKMQKKGWDQNSVAADPMFVDIQNFDFTMKPESPALKLGFKPIEGLETIGLLSEPAFARLRKAGGLEALMKVEAHPSEVFPD